MHEVRVLRREIPSQESLLQRLDVSVVQKYVGPIDTFISELTLLPPRGGRYNQGGAITNNSAGDLIARRSSLDSIRRELSSGV